MLKIVNYLNSPEALIAVLLPGLVSLGWLVRAHLHKETDARLIRAWIACVVATYLLSRWRVTDEMRQLFIIPVFLIYLAFRMHAGYRISPLAAFALTFLASWTVDMARALELACAGEVRFDEFYFGVGGAGLIDALLVAPLIAAALVHYVEWRAHSPVAQHPVAARDTAAVLWNDEGARYGHMNRRSDQLTSARINSAHWTMIFFGRQAAASKLRKQGVPLQLALRVLTRPVKRPYLAGSIV